ncbi:flagellar filament capping protein FliD [Chitinimonas sp. BJB300]|uniref:flagellar filament capping protein FliD n=1 Tax=Chitinimonas sp. BJB300 TaxID=1559339 RepID=UPI000C1025FC|nr:flagellar filament capping protein FliD [Chitinimonas sp. BJB300]PHV10753.1 hypothetical protein CSQ89_14515 [Chitinimonas sp. BJB300]TSJ89975.1 hypothetical protein FG002_007230 [Chitinimonas sp. BJB300]
MSLYGIGNSVSQAYAFSGINRNGTVQSASSNDEKLRWTSSTNVRLSEAGRLQSALVELKTSAGNLDSLDKVAKVKAKSDNQNISANISRTDVPPQTLNVEVSQLAQSQRVRSQAFADRDSSIVGTGSLQIEFGRFNSNSNSFTPNDGSKSATVSISAGDGTLNGIAKAINRANVGVDAKVVEDNGSFRLDLSGQKTGGDQAFRIRVSDSDGSNRDNSQGLSRLAYDPSELPGTGRNLDVNRNAKFAELTLNGKAIISSTNEVNNVDRGIALRLSSTGVAKIDVARDADEANSSARTFVEAINRFTEKVESGQSDSSARNRIVGQIDKALNSAQSSGETNKITLEQIGIKRDRQGTLTLDEDKLGKAFSKDPEKVSSLLADAANRVKNASNTALTNSKRTTTLDSTNLLARSDNPYAAQTRLQQFQSRYAEQPTLFSYSPSTQNLYGLSQYLSISGL